MTQPFPDIKDKISALLVFPEFRKIAVFSVCCLICWIAAFYFLEEGRALSTKVILQEARYGQLLDLADKYRQMAPPTFSGNGEVHHEGAKEPLEAISYILEQEGLKSNLVQLSSLPAGVNIQLEGLYGEDMGSLIQQLRLQGLAITSAELKSIPGNDGGGLLFNIAMIIGRKS